MLHDVSKDWSDRYCAVSISQILKGKLSGSLYHMSAQQENSFEHEIGVRL